jgi:hypothetical protein
MAKGKDQDARGLALVILGIVTIIGVISLVLLFSGARKGTGKLALPSESYSVQALPSGYSNEGPSEFRGWIGYCRGAGYGASYYEYQKPEPLAQCDEYWVRVQQGADCYLTNPNACPRESAPSLLR